MEDTEKAKTVINEALEKCPDVIKLYLQMLGTKYSIPQLCITQYYQ